MAEQNKLKAASWVFLVSVCMGTGLAKAATEQTPINADLQRYLDCVNNAAKAQQAEGSDKLSNAQSVISTCENQKQALLQALPGRGTLKIIGRIEGHLKKREKPK